MAMAEWHEIKEFIEAALGRRPPTVVIRNAEVLNVFTKELIRSDIVVYRDRIVNVGHFPDLYDRAEYVFDADGAYAVPGLMDAHIHIESTMLLPAELAKLLVPRGVTSLFADPHELSNVLGVEGVEALLSLSSNVPLRVFIEVPSRVPTAPGLETTGGVLGLGEVERLLKLRNSVSLGELNYQNLFSLREEYLRKIEIATKMGKVVNGHAPMLSGREIDAIAAAGIMDDHESVRGEEALEKLRHGIAVMIREGTSERNADELISYLVGRLRDFSNVLFCTDDKHPEDIMEEGHVDYIVRKAIALGMDPVDAILAATYNIARHFRLDHVIGAIAPGRYADIVLVRNLRSFEVKATFFGGKLVYSNGKLLWKPEKIEFPNIYLKTIKLRAGLKPEDLIIKVEPKEGTAVARTIELIPTQIINREIRVELPVRNHIVLSDPERDIARIAVVERHGMEGNVGKAFIKGFGLQRGAIASSVAHDHHNIVVVGHDPEDMLYAVKHLEEIGGGFTAVLNGRVLADVPLPFAGLLSLKSAEEVIEELRTINEVVKAKLGCSIKSPFMQLEFITLPTVPELGLTDKGLIDVRSYSIIDPIISVEAGLPERFYGT